MQTDLVAALDIGGTKIAGALVDDHGRILVRAQRRRPRRRTATPSCGPWKGCSAS